MSRVGVRGDPRTGKNSVKVSQNAETLAETTACGRSESTFRGATVITHRDCPQSALNRKILLLPHTLQSPSPPAPRISAAAK